MMEPNSAARKPLLEDQKGADDYSADDESGGLKASGGGGATGSESRPPHGQRQGGGVEGRIEGVLMRERRQASSPPGSGGSGDVTAGDTEPEGGMSGGSGGVFVV